MVLRYRWMQKKDLQKVAKSSKDPTEVRNSFKSLLNQTKTVANVAELDDEILGWVVYRLDKDKLKIVKIAFKDDRTVEFIIENMRNRAKNKSIQVDVSEYDLRLQLLLKKFSFTVVKTKKINESDFYTFVG
jgi:hypothetical protein